METESQVRQRVNKRDRQTESGGFV